MGASLQDRPLALFTTVMTSYERNTFLAQVAQVEQWFKV